MIGYLPDVYQTLNKIHITTKGRMRMHAVSSNNTSTDCLHAMCGFRGVDPPPPHRKITKIGFLSNTGPDPVKSQTTKPAINVGPSSARQRYAISMAFRWRADDGPLLVVFSILSPLIN